MARVHIIAGPGLELHNPLLHHLWPILLHAAELPLWCTAAHYFAGQSHGDLAFPIDHYATDLHGF